MFITHYSVYPSVGEALGAIGDPVVLALLKDYSQDPVIEVRTEHCSRFQLY